MIDWISKGQENKGRAKKKKKKERNKEIYQQVISKDIKKVQVK